MKTVLKTLGFSSYEAKKLTEEHGENILQLLSSVSGREKLYKSVEQTSVDNAALKFCRIYKAKNLFDLLLPYKISENVIFELFKYYNEDEKKCIDTIKEDPYSMIYTAGVSFPCADVFAENEGPNQDDDESRIKGSVYSVLNMIECGTEDLEDCKFGNEFEAFISDRAGSMCIPFNELIYAASLLLGTDPEDDDKAYMIAHAAKSLHRQKAILLTKKNGVMFVYKARNAGIEFSSAEMIKERKRLSSESPLKYKSNPFKEIDDSQASLGLNLSYEQANAVYTALTNRISVITGGPGTGKTATQKVLLEAYRRLSGNKPVLLMAPTGQAAKRMSQATDYPASTIHSALGISPAEKDLNAGKYLNPGLIIMDETSMVDATLFNMLLRHVSKSTILVVVGDVEQLPSIGAGAVLRELINCVPVSRLTKVFRQGDGSDIAFNAARIKAGTKQMIEGEKFSFIEADTSENIQKAVCEEYRRQVDAVGGENVVVLTPFRKSTPTGVNQLNEALRKAIGKDKNKYVKYEAMRIYEGDKVIFLRNRNGLVNGEIGSVEEIRGDKAVCKFGEKELILSGSELNMIIPAYSQTVHKSQGAGATRSLLKR